MGFKICSFILILLVSILMHGCRTCQTCEFQRTSVDAIQDTVQPYASAVCGTNKDLKAFEKKCDVDAQTRTENSPTGLIYKCVCSEFE